MIEATTVSHCVKELEISIFLFILTLHSKVEQRTGTRKRNGD